MQHKFTNKMLPADEHFSLESEMTEDDSRLVCRNVSHQEQLFLEVPSPRRSL